MLTPRFHCQRRGVEGYPPCVRGWFRLAEAGRMRRGFRDVGLLLARRLGRCRPRKIARQAWHLHVETLRHRLGAADDQPAIDWFTTTYPTLATLVPATAWPAFVAGLRDHDQAD